MSSNSAGLAAEQGRRSEPETNWAQRVLDQKRLAVLLRTTLLDSTREPDFDRLTRLSARLLSTPLVLVSLVDADRQFFKSEHGLAEPWASERQTPLSHSICKHVVAADAPLVLADARRSPALQDNPAIADLGVVAYAGVPLRAGGEAVGAFCAIDTRPRDWSNDEIELLQELALAVEAQVALRLANAELKQRERLLDSVLDLMPAGVVVRDLHGSVLRTNAAAGRILGRTPEEVAQIGLRELAHPDDHADDVLSRAQLLQGAASVVTRTKRYLHKDGRWIWARRSASLLCDASGKTQGTIAVIEDVTVEHQAREALSRQEGIYRAIASNMPRSAVFMFDHELRYLAADGPELLAAAGLNREQIEGKTLAEVARPENRPALQSLYQRALAGEPGEFEVVRGGRTLLVRATPVLDAERVVAGLSLVQDVTDERRQSAELRRAKHQFEVTIANIADGVALLDAKRMILLANRAYADFFGLQLSELQGMRREAFVGHVASLVEDRQHFIRRIETGFAAPGNGTTEDFVLLRPRRRVVRRRMSPIELFEGTGYLVVWQESPLTRS